MPNRVDYLLELAGVPKDFADIRGKIVRFETVRDEPVVVVFEGTVIGRFVEPNEVTLVVEGMRTTNVYLTFTGGVWMVHDGTAARRSGKLTFIS